MIDLRLFESVIMSPKIEFRASLFFGIRRFFASGQIPIGKISGGQLQAATLKSSCIVLFACLLKIHSIESRDTL